jgi:hypothetical protein
MDSGAQQRNPSGDCAGADVAELTRRIAMSEAAMRIPTSARKPTIRKFGAHFERTEDG